MIESMRRITFLLVFYSNIRASSAASTIQERLVNATNIIARMSFTTMTSCSMNCLANSKCSAIAFDVNPAMEKNSECLMLEKVEDSGIKNVTGLQSLFVVILKNETNFATTKPIIPLCPIDGRWSAWGLWEICGPSCGKSQIMRNRACDNPRPQHGGKNCTGANNEAKSCEVKCSVTDFCKSKKGKTTLYLYDNQGTTTGSIPVECVVLNGVQYTNILHDALTMRRFDNKMNYNAISTINWDQATPLFIRQVIEQFSYCIQRFHLKTRYNYPVRTCFVIWNGQRFCMNDALCHGCNVVNDSGNVATGYAYVDDKRFLPFTGMEFLDNDNENEFLEITMNGLRCR